MGGDGWRLRACGGGRRVALIGARPPSGAGVILSSDHPKSGFKSQIKGSVAIFEKYRLYYPMHPLVSRRMTSHKTFPGQRCLSGVMMGSGRHFVSEAVLVIVRWSQKNRQYINWQRRLVAVSIRRPLSLADVPKHVRPFFYMIEARI
ncbi:uncharacterized protein LOC133920993 [Phragmites australis]|uniref:uncharacterized protein LOC133920993 n=1 Tax=Phragmites australis TaxID=29695 RepID=UPI002D78DAEC|nr:uncharacterized protein LOC133920993 [Phragmites australis]